MSLFNSSNWLLQLLVLLLLVLHVLLAVFAVSLFLRISLDGHIDIVHFIILLIDAVVHSRLDDCGVLIVNEMIGRHFQQCLSVLRSSMTDHDEHAAADECAADLTDGLRSRHLGIIRTEETVQSALVEDHIETLILKFQLANIHHTNYKEKKQ